MLPKLLRKERLEAFVAGLMERCSVVGPKKKPEAEWYYFDVLEDPQELRLDYTVTTLSPKKFLLPATGEVLLRFDGTADPPTTEAVVEAPEQVIFGMHPCDIRALTTLVAAYGDDPQDANFLTRRENTIIVGLDCLEPCDEHSFCADMKSNEAESGYDVMLTDLGETYFVEVATDRGVRLVEGADLPDATNREFARLQQVRAAKGQAFAPRLPFDTKYLPEILEESYDSLVWQATAQRCFSCGSCVLVCPTCYCFDVADVVDLTLVRGERRRTWDGCMLEGFARVAGGENFRPEREDRLRHRVMRKGKYITEKFERPGCVGCGRCERACLVKISMKEMFTQVAGSR